ncbi:MAG: Ig-like domain-containing protein [Gemmatimonadota bacterium]
MIVSPVRLELSPGDSIRLRVEGLDANAEAVSRIRPVWTVRPPHRASVDSTGLVIAHAEGEIVVTATVGRRSSVASGTIEPGRR